MAFRFGLLPPRDSARQAVWLMSTGSCEAPDGVQRRPGSGVGEIQHDAQLVHAPDDGFPHLGEPRVRLLIMGSSQLVPGAVGQLAVADAEPVEEVETPDGILDVGAGKNRRRAGRRAR